ncbi:MAG: hypothetical protein MJ223_00615 [Mycoplasmoidaceae bacterium]|nr:hypothetical protein [Mycoplasmoidaceae bacterium]
MRNNKFYSSVNMGVSIAFIVVGFMFISINHLILAKVRGKKVFHALYTRGPGEVFRMIGAG